MRAFFQKTLNFRRSVPLTLVNRDLIIQKSDIGNSTVMLDKNDYIKRMIEMLSDSSIFKKVN